jgi:RNA polymerase sigma-70 factor (ECF subfamily)
VASPSKDTMDSTVMERARAGDLDALGKVIRHYDADLRALAYRLLGDRDRMDDVLQDAYVKAIRAFPRFRGESTLATWLYRIVYNACLDELDKSRRVRVLPLEHAGDRPDPGPLVAEAVPARTALAEALATLAPPDRAAVLLVDAQGFDYESAGEVLGVPAGTIASRLNRARRVLRRALGEELEGVS